PAGISATDAEKGLAFEKAMEVSEGLASMGWPEPVVVDSGNGYYLLYRVDLPADDGGLVHRCIQALQPAASDHVHIDISVANPSRICRLPGTWNRKGDDMPDRPHRVSEVMDAPDAPQAVTVALLEALAATLAPELETRPVAPYAPVSGTGDRPGDDFNKRGDIAPVLESHGWQRIGESGGNQLWRRPGKTMGNHSATFDGRTFYVFSSAAQPFEANQGYSLFAVYAMLEHGGDFKAASASLAAEGYGGEPPGDGVDISGIMATFGAARADDADSSEMSATMPTGGTSPGQSVDNSEKPTPFDLFQPRTLAERFAEGFALNPPVIHGLLREGETMNLIAPPKIGKSWMVSALAISVASGLDWLGFPVEQGPVLHIDNELHANTSTYRYNRVAEAMGVPPHLFGNQLTTVSLRGRLADLNHLGTLFAAYPPGAFKLVIIDAFYRTLPSGTDENDNGAIAGLYNLIDLYAMRLGCAFVLIHHTSKGNQSGKLITDVGAGAGSQSRAVDTHACLRQHEEENLVVLEAAPRSWPPSAPLALEWKWPLFTPVAEVDTSALMGTARTQAAKKPLPSLGEFVETCIGPQEPCSARAVVYAAQQAHGMTKRAAEDMLALAMEKGLVEKIKADGAHMRHVKARSDLVGDKAKWIAAIRENSPGLGVADIAERTGVSERYVRQIRQQLDDEHVTQQEA
ncbi:MAG: AAA family ATPase, partial [Lentisphaerae bacterium]|nr:AAA family ATPase [Lentisphaerota bacterium]